MSLSKTRIFYDNKSAFLLCFIFLFFYILNILTCMSFGDDYVYSFVWEGHSMFEPMSEHVKRLSSFYDLLISQLSHYLTGNGRTVSHTIVQFFLWMGKDIFNFFNALISVFLIIEIYWCANKGIISFDFKIKMLAFIFFGIWAFTPSFPSVFLWLSGACNYLWTAVFLLAFLLPYVRKYYYSEEKIASYSWFQFVMFFFGIIAGWTNENSICWIILILLLFIYVSKKRSNLESWMVAGIGGLIIGYAFMMFAPGNIARLSMEAKESELFTWEKLQEHVALMFLLFIYFHIFPWYFNLRSFFSLKGKYKESLVLGKDVLLTKILCLVSFCMSFMMLLSPNFPARSAFPGTVLLIISTSILLRIQNEYDIILIRKSATTFLRIVGCIYFVVTVVSTFYGSYYYYEQISELTSYVKSSDYAKKNVIVVNSLRPVHDLINKSCYFHLISYEMSSEENDWRNVAFSRYYGIKGIRVIKKEDEKK